MAAALVLVLALALGGCAEPPGASSIAPLPPALSPPAQPLSMAQQTALQQAVAQYEAGRADLALPLFQALARQRVPAAAYNLAVMHLRGEMPKSSASCARHWLLRAARGGFVTAQFSLGQALENGLLGERNLQLAHDWYQRAAESGSVAAQVAIGTAYYLGRGRPRDGAQALQWYREAATRGDIGAMYLVASMYEQGDGAVADLRLARYWYTQAAELGDEAAPFKLRELALREAI